MLFSRLRSNQKVTSTLAWKDTSVGIRWLLVSKQECEMHKQVCTAHRDSKGRLRRSKSSTRLEARGSQMEILPIAGLTFHQGPYVKETKKKKPQRLRMPWNILLSMQKCSISHAPGMHPKTWMFSLLHFTTKYLFTENTGLNLLILFY